MIYAIGFDLGGTNLKIVAVTAEGETLEKSALPTQDGAEVRDAWTQRIREQTRRIVNAQGEGLYGIGLAAPGLAAADARSIRWMQGRMEAVQGLDWTDALGGEHFVPVLNDAQAALLGETWLGAAAGSRNAILLTLGTGVGGAAMVDGNLLRGHIGRAGHLGHICLNPDGAPDIVGTPGSLEDAIGDCTIAARTGGRFPSTAALLDAKRTGDAFAAEVWAHSVRLLACGIVSLVNAFDPEIVILGGGVSRAGDELFAPLQAELNANEWRPTGSKVRLVPAALGEFAGAYGAACRALQEKP